jgi:hypothetical protein
MKIYISPDPPFLIRINIKKQGEKTEHLTLCETTQKEVFQFIKKLIEKQNISPFQKGRLTTIEIREALGSDNLKSVSLSFKGINCFDTKNLILKAIK